MNGKGFKKATQDIGRTLARNSPTILTGISVAGLFTTVGMAINATPKAYQILGGKGWRKSHPSKKEIIKLTWRCYVPTIIMGGVTIACVIGANSINLRRNAALASAYSLTEVALKEYQSKVIETIGVAKEQKIKDSIDEDTINKNPVKDSEVIITGKGEMLCFETISGRYFYDDIENIRRIQNELNFDLMNDGFISMNDVYEKLNLPYSDIGEDLGWYAKDGLMEFRFSSQLTTKGVPCLVVGYHRKPEYNHQDY